MPIQMTRNGIITFFALLYFVQGATQSYIRNFQKPYLSGIGISAEEIGFLSFLLMLPFIIKIVFGYISDRFNFFGLGHRRPYLAMGILVAGLGFLGASVFLPEHSMGAFRYLIVLASFGVALFDSTADGLAIEVSREKDQGLVQSAMTAGKAAGLMILAIVIGQMAPVFGYQAVFLLLGVLTLIPLVLLTRIPEPVKRGKSDHPSPKELRTLFRWDVALFLIYALSYTYVSFGVDGLLSYFLRKTHQVPDELLGWFGSLSGVGAIIGAIIAGVCLFRFANFKVAVVSMLLVAGGAIAAAHVLNPETMLVFAIAWGAVWAFQETVFVTYAMKMSKNSFAASTFAFMMVISNIGQALTENFSTAQTATIGFTGVFTRLALISLIPIATLWFMVRFSSKR